MKQVSIYIHIPYCVQICHYCDFAVSRFHKDEEIDVYVDALEKEIEMRLTTLPPFNIPSIYFGGGTPSLLTRGHLEGILGKLSQYGKWGTDCEITLEANPDTLDDKKARDWRDLGINRISLGAQSFHDRTLKTLGRLHRKDATTLAVNILKRNELLNINLDLIYGLPGETGEDFQTSLTQAIQLDPTHVSLYQLDIQKKTLFFVLKNRGQLPLPEENTVLQMHESALLQFKQAGIDQYELQNFARPGFESIHNLRYWTHQDFLGFGVGAYSYFASKRFGHTKNLSHYLKQSEKRCFDPEVTETISKETKMKESLILGLRLNKGIDLNELENETGQITPMELIQKLDQLSEKKLVEKANGSYRLSVKGQHLSETIASELV